IENAETAWQRYYSEGDVEAGMTGRGRALVSFLNWQGHTRALCEVGGYSALHLLENVGAREPRVRWLHCLEDGAPERCQWEYSCRSETSGPSRPVGAQLGVAVREREVDQLQSGVVGSGVAGHARGRGQIARGEQRKTVGRTGQCARPARQVD